MSALRRLFELILLMSVGAIALCASHEESRAARDEALQRMADRRPESQSTPSRSRAGDSASTETPCTRMSSGGPSPRASAAARRDRPGAVWMP
jgi:hypothetical protein